MKLPKTIRDQFLDTLTVAVSGGTVEIEATDASSRALLNFTPEDARLVAKALKRAAALAES